MQSYLNFHELQVVCRYNFRWVKGGGEAQGRIQNLKKEGRREFGGSPPRFFGIFRPILKEKRGGRAPPATPSGSAADPGPVVKTASLESRRSRVRTPLWPSGFKDAICFFSLTRIDSILCGTCVAAKYSARPRTARAQISNPVSGVQCNLTIFERFSWPNLVYLCTKVAYNPFHCLFQLIFMWVGIAHNYLFNLRTNIGKGLVSNNCNFT